MESKQVDTLLNELYDSLRARDPHQTVFLQAVQECCDSLKPLFQKNPHLIQAMHVICEPDRSIQFRVAWMDDQQKMRVNRGYRVQFNSALGPYKGGLRFHPSVNLSIIKFLGFEQNFKNALTSLPLGGGKGGSDFDPKGKSDMEVLRFCQSFMNELSRYIGLNMDVPAGDIGVGGREIGYLYGHYRMLKNEALQGSLTGKGPQWGGSLLRPEATGYGLVYFTLSCLNAINSKNNTNDNAFPTIEQVYSSGKEYFNNKRCLVSGSGNVAQYTVEKLLSFGAKVLTMSDSSGYIYEPNGFTTEGLEYMKKLKNERRGRVSEYVREFNTEAKFVSKKKVWEVTEVDYAFPCATQNEIQLEDAKLLIQNNCKILAEGANMPSTNEAVSAIRDAGVIYLPAKAANCGGVATSGFEMSQNALRLSWTREEVDQKLQGVMYNVCKNSYNVAEEYDLPMDWQFGANAAGFLRVATSLIEQGTLVISK